MALLKLNKMSFNIKTFLNSFPLNTVIPEQETINILNVLENHPNFEEKSNGMSHLEIKKNMPYQSKGFHFCFPDRESVSISYIEALKPSSHNSNVQKTARHSIGDQILEFNRLYFNSSNDCELCGETIEPNQPTHTDHIVLFKNIWTDFLSESKITVDEIRCVNLGKGICFFEEPLLSKWQVYHKEKAKLRITHAHCNLTRRKS
jgi:hypothetical protein